MDDVGLVEAIRAGDRDAFRDLVEREQTALFRTCYRILGRVGDAEDAVQESLVIAYRALGTYRGEGGLAAWLSRIAARQALRRLGQRRDLAPLEPLLEANAGPSGGPDPLHHVLMAERERQVREAVAGLPEPYREVVALRFFAELSLKEIADVSGRPLGTVKTHLHRGLRLLRGRLGREVAA